MNRLALTLVLAVPLVAGCQDDNPPMAVHDVTPPAAPRGFYSVTGDNQVTLHWLGNTEPDLAGYKVYVSPCANGPSCPYDFVLTTVGTNAVVSQLDNGVTHYFAVAAFDRAGNEGDLSYADVFDTPRPAGTGLILGDATAEPALSGVDFSAYALPTFRLPWDDPTPMCIRGALSGAYMYAAYTDTDIQDAGYDPASLDAVDFAPNGGWSPDGSVQLIEGHNYVVWTHDNHFAKFRVIQLTASPDRVQLNWAYQTDPGNPELLATRPRAEGPRVRRVFRPRT
jgi:hypothetical protein